jgi:membrane-bound lytic murein transglycosylase B
MRLRRLMVVSATVIAVPALASPALAAGGASGGTAYGGGTAAGPPTTGGSAPTGQKPATPPAPKKAVKQVTPGAGSADIPAVYLRTYRSAAKAKGVDWRIVAAIGKIESDHGRSRAAGVAKGLNYAKCCAGPMQFCIVKSCGNTWGYYGVDGNGDGRRNVYDPADAIPGAAAFVADLQRMVGTRTDLTLASYNAGPAYARKHKRVPPYPETQNYVRKALAYIRGL